MAQKPDIPSRARSIPVLAMDEKPYLRIWMLDGFNENWITFGDNGRRTIKGSISARAVIAALVASASA